MPLLNEVSTGALGDDQDKKIESLVKQINEQNRLISNEDRTKIIKDSSGTPRVLFGEGPSQFYGLKVSKTGFDVTSTGDSNLAFNSSQNVFKIVQSGTYTVSSSNATSSPAAGSFAANSFTIATIPHGLGYAPAVIGFLYDGSTQYIQTPFSGYGGSGTQGYWYTYYMTVDSTNLKIMLNTLATGGSNTFLPGQIFKYYLLQETAS